MAVQASDAPALAGRGRVLLGTVLAQLGLGTVYSWSILNPPLAQRLLGDHTQTFGIAITFSIMMICLSVSTLSIGWLQARFGVRKVLVACGIVLACGLFVSGFVGNVWLLYLFAGIVVGAADGVGYLLSLTNCLRWYPDRAGTISGVSVGAYGVPAVILPFVVTPVLGDAASGYPGLTMCFIIWAVVALLLIAGGGLLLRDAPHTGNAGQAAGEYTRGQMLRTPQSYLLFIGITAFCFAGLFIIGNAGGAALSGPTATDRPTAYLIGTAISLVSLVAVVNTIGRFFFGWLSDHIKRTLIVAVALSVLAVFALLLGLTWLPSPWLYILGFLFFGAAFGGCITIYPAIVGDFYGHNNQSKNYSVIYQGFAAGAVITLIFNSLMAAGALTFGTALLIGCAFMALAAVILFAIRAPGAPPQTGGPDGPAPATPSTTHVTQK
ncbi:MFS transporter [Brevibacterium sp. 50QC2O2]|uniref:MFS transporter n=1 Tax=Brevibacterium TaxID=1696 RepID=UPI00211C5AFA|nr:MULTISPECIES: MFS transporter [unclassified Brevibacterium]MCQ9367717.1 MFS transporter [Brevibacterium sp. 91QC2O2]MCQ9384977.1 MFS transporter [Brevibacterium sp. 68QC2CO]MCQ9387976.1 MFS transporter [Brevibacterium sp. 50QC2O2]